MLYTCSVAMRKQVFILVLMIVLPAIILPYWIAFSANATPELFGGFLINPLDGNSYLAKMMLGASGEWKFRLPFTSDAEPSAYLFLFYIFLGHLCQLLQVQPVYVFHAARVAGALFLLFSMWIFYGRVFREKSRQAELAFVISAIGSGMGWIAALLERFTADFWVAEAYPFLSMYVNPHFPIGLGLVLLFFACLMGEPQAREYPLMVLGGFLLSIIMPFQMVIAAIVGSLYVIYLWMINRKLNICPLLAFFSLGGAYILYQFWVTKADPYLSLWDQQNLTPSPPVWDFLLSLAPWILIAIIGCWLGLTKLRFSRGQILLVIWGIAGIVLIYFPFSLQRRLMTGFMIPVVGVAVATLFFIRKAPLRKLTIILFLTFAPFTNIMVISAGISGAATRSEALYLSDEEFAALQWIDENTDADDIILSAPDFGAYLPARTGRRVIYGHPFETIHADERIMEIAEFYRVSGSAQAREWLEQNQVAYILYGVRERRLGTIDENAFDKVFQKGSMTIYQVTEGP